MPGRGWRAAEVTQRKSTSPRKQHRSRRGVSLTQNPGTCIPAKIAYPSAPCIISPAAVGPWGAGPPGPGELWVDSLTHGRWISALARPMGHEPSNGGPLSHGHCSLPLVTRSQLTLINAPGSPIPTRWTC